MMEAEDTERRFNALLGEMKRFDPDGDYYALTVGADRRGNPFWASVSHWVNWSPRGRQWEIRAASLVDPTKVTKAWTLLEQGWLSVHRDAHLSVFLNVGGNALVEKEFAESHLPDVIEASECMRDGSFEVGGSGFIGTGHLPDEAVNNRAPGRKLRMAVLKRDKYRCVICGRRAADHIDIELHVHHLIPWRMGGPTAEENLVTLCGTCHKGLDPDFEPRLRELAGLPGRSSILDRNGTEFSAEVERYQEWAHQALSDHPAYEDTLG